MKHYHDHYRGNAKQELSLNFTVFELPCVMHRFTGSTGIF